MSRRIALQCWRRGTEKMYGQISLCSNRSIHTAATQTNASQRKEHTTGTTTTALPSAAPSSTSPPPASSPSPYLFPPLCFLRSVYRSKFGIPRQGALSPSSTAVLSFSPSSASSFSSSDAAHHASPLYAHENWKAAFRELEQCTHLWLVFVFHAHTEQQHKQAQQQQQHQQTTGAEHTHTATTSSSAAATPSLSAATAWSPLVRPPRLGGSTSVGVFASRSPYRPNRIGLSVVKLDRVEYEECEPKESSSGEKRRVERVHVHVSGVDLLDGTPILDLKPYVPYCDSFPSARIGWAEEVVKRFPVRMENLQLAALVDSIDANYASSSSRDVSSLPVHFKALLLDLLSLDPRHGYQQKTHPVAASHSQGKIYGMQLADWNVEYRIEEQGFVVQRVEKMEEFEARKMKEKQDRKQQQTTNA